MVEGKETDGGRWEVECWRASDWGSLVGLRAGQSTRETILWSALGRKMCLRTAVHSLEAHRLAKRVWKPPLTNQGTSSSRTLSICG